MLLLVLFGAVLLPALGAGRPVGMQSPPGAVSPGTWHSGSARGSHPAGSSSASPVFQITGLPAGTVDLHEPVVYSVTSPASANYSSPPQWTGLPPHCTYGANDTTVSCVTASVTTLLVQATARILEGQGPVNVTSNSVKTTVQDDPRLQLQTSPLMGVAPLTVWFTATLSGGSSAKPYVYDWILGDGSIAQGPSPNVTYSNISHTYAAAGTYEVELWANDSTAYWNATYGSVQRSILVVVSAPPEKKGPFGLVNPYGYLAIGAIVLALALLLAVWFLYGDRSKRLPPPEPWMIPPEEPLERPLPPPWPPPQP